jgi:excisionase family DNA binding protein
MRTTLAIPPYLMTLRDAAAYLSISYDSIRALVSTGHIRAAKPKGRLIRVYRTSVEAYAERCGDPTLDTENATIPTRPRATKNLDHPLRLVGKGAA